MDSNGNAVNGDGNFFEGKAPLGGSLVFFVLQGARGLRKCQLVV
jgi:hypothetical protein